MASVVNKSRGRPSQPTHAREKILHAAQQRFSSHGYDRTSVRAVARDAGVDHALVNYYFGSKEGLFRRVAELALSPAAVFDAMVGTTPVGQLPEALLRAGLASWDHPEYQQVLSRLLLDAAASDAAQRTMQEYLQAELVARLAALIGGRWAYQRAACLGSVIAGVYFTRYVLRLEPMASMAAEDIVHQVAPAMRAILASRYRPHA